jgi:hypothetical protein
MPQLKQRTEMSRRPDPVVPSVDALAEIWQQLRMCHLRYARIVGKSCRQTLEH